MENKAYSGSDSSANLLERKTPGEDNVHRLQLGGKDIFLVGTAHVSGRSADLVARIIRAERPDSVCVELCNERYSSILRNGLTQKVNLLDILKRRRGLFVLWFMLWYFQKKVGERLGIKPGTEVVRAIEAATATGADVCPVDRDIRVTLGRAWGLIGFTTRMALAAQLLFSLRSLDKIREEDIENMKRDEMVETLVDELGKSHPVLRQVLVDERDEYMAEKIADAPGDKIVAVVGAAHVPGILRRWKSSGAVQGPPAATLKAA